MSTPNVPTFITPDVPGRTSNAVPSADNWPADMGVDFKARYRSPGGPNDGPADARFTLTQTKLKGVPCPPTLAYESGWSLTRGATSSFPFPTVASSRGAVYHGGRVYIIGMSGIDAHEFNYVWSAPVNGLNVGTWRAEQPIPSSFAAPAYYQKAYSPIGDPIVIGDHMYVLCGANGFNGGGWIYCDINNDGTLSGWKETGQFWNDPNAQPYSNFPIGSFASGVDLGPGPSGDPRGGWLLVFYANGSNSVWAFQVMPDGTLSSTNFPNWPSLPGSVNYGGVVIDGHGYVYVIPGDPAGGTWWGLMNLSTGYPDTTYNSWYSGPTLPTWCRQFAMAASPVQVRLPGQADNGDGISMWVFGGGQGGNAVGQAWNITGGNFRLGHAWNWAGGLWNYTPAYACGGCMWPMPGQHPSWSHAYVIGLFGGYKDWPNYQGSEVTEVQTFYPQGSDPGGWEGGFIISKGVPQALLEPIAPNRLEAQTDGSYDYTFRPGVPNESFWAGPYDGDEFTVGVQFASQATGDVSAMGLTSFHYGKPPSVANLQPDTLSHGHPTISWTFTPGAQGGYQKSWQVQIWAGSEFIADSGVRQTQESSWQPGPAPRLRPGIQYTVTVTVTSTDTSFSDTDSVTATETVTFIPDFVQPLPPTDLAVTTDADRCALIATWYNPVTVGYNRIYYRRTPRAVTDDQTWYLLEDMVPASPGTQDTKVLMDQLAIGGSYDFAISSMDVTGSQESVLTENLVTNGDMEHAGDPEQPPTQAAVFADDFDTQDLTVPLTFWRSLGTDSVGNLDAWAIDAGSAAVPGGEITPDAIMNDIPAGLPWSPGTLLTQSSFNVGSGVGPNTAVVEPGTIARGGHPDWTDIGYWLRFAMPVGGAGRPRAFVRMRDASNWIGVSYGAGGRSSMAPAVDSLFLSKMVHGHFTLLRWQPYQVVPGNYWFQVVCSGTTITAYLRVDSGGAPGNVVASVSEVIADDVLQQGQVGLGNGSAASSEVQFGGPFANVCQVTGYGPVGDQPSKDSNAGEPAYAWPLAASGSHQVSIYQAPRQTVLGNAYWQARSEASALAAQGSVDYVFSATVQGSNLVGTAGLTVEEYGSGGALLRSTLVAQLPGGLTDPTGIQGRLTTQPQTVALALRPTLTGAGLAYFDSVQVARVIPAPALWSSLGTDGTGDLSYWEQITGAYADMVLADKPEAYWRMSDAPSLATLPRPAQATDATGHGHTGTTSGNLTISPEGATRDGDGSFTFDGGTAQVAVPSWPALGATWSIECWFKIPQTLSTNQFLAIIPGGNLFILNTDPIYGGRLQWNDNTTALTSPGVVTDGRWHHTVVTFDGSTGRMYIDAVEVASYTHSYAAWTSGTVYLGSGGGNNFAGNLDEVALYRYALTAERVAEHYHQAGPIQPWSIASNIASSPATPDRPLIGGHPDWTDVTFQTRFLWVTGAQPAAWIRRRANDGIRVHVDGTQFYVSKLIRGTLTELYAAPAVLSATAAQSTLDVIPSGTPWQYGTALAATGQWYWFRVTASGGVFTASLYPDFAGAIGSSPIASLSWAASDGDVERLAHGQVAIDIAGGSVPCRFGGAFPQVCTVTPAGNAVADWLPIPSTQDGGEPAYAWDHLTDPYDTTILADDPEGYWPLDDTDATVRDATEHGYSGTTLGAVTTGVQGATADGDGSMAFDGLTGQAMVPDLPAQGEAFTAEALARVPSALGYGQDVLSLPFSSRYAGEVLDDSPVLYWRLNDTGTTIRDLAGHGYTGQIASSVKTGQPGALADGDGAMTFPDEATGGIATVGASGLPWTQPNAPVVTTTAGGATGTSTWGYKVAAVMGNGDTVPSPQGQSTNGVATLTSTNSQTITKPTTMPSEATGWRVIRTASGGTPASTGVDISGVLPIATTSFVDTGVAGTAWEPKASYSLEFWLNVTLDDPANAWPGVGISWVNNWDYEESMRLYLAGSVQSGAGTFWWDSATYYGVRQAVITPGSVADGAWHHIVLTTDQTTARLYVDGEFAASTVAPFPPLEPTVTMGTVYNNSPGFGGTFGGSLDEFAIYDYALSAARVQAHYEAAPATRAHLLVTTAGKLQYTDGVNTLTAPAAMADGKWHHVGFAFDGVTGHLYQDGESVASLSGSFQPPAAGVLEMASGPSGRLAGGLAKVALHGAALTPSQMARRAWAAPAATHTNSLSVYIPQTAKPGDGAWASTLASESIAIPVQPGATYKVTGRLLASDVVAGSTRDAYSGTVLADRPVTYYRMDQVVGTLTDVSGNGHDAVTLGGVRPVPGVTADGDEAMEFDGITGYGDASPIPAPNALNNTYEANIKAYGPLVYYRLNDQTTTVVDHSSYGRNGSLFGTVNGGQFAAVADGSHSMQFDGATGGISSPSFTVPATHSTEAWFNTTSSGSLLTIMALEYSGERVYLDNGSLLANDAVHQVGPGPGGYNDGRWHHVVFTYDGTTARIYVDSELYASNVTAWGTESGGGFNVGLNVSQNYFSGYIAEAAVYGYALSDAQVLDHWQQAQAKYSIECWLKVPAGTAGLPSSYCSIIDLASTGVARLHLMGTVYASQYWGQMEFYAGNGTPGLDHLGPYNDGQWHHFVITIDALNKGVMYVDGVPVDTEIPATPRNRWQAPTGGWDMQLMQLWGLAKQPGVLDEVAIYDHVLTQDRVTAHYEAIAGVGAHLEVCEWDASGSLVATWPVEQDVGGLGMAHLPEPLGVTEVGPVVGTSPEWQDIELTGTVGASTTYLSIRPRLLGTGLVWFDDVAVEQEGTSPSGTVPDPASGFPGIIHIAGQGDTLFARLPHGSYMRSQIGGPTVTTVLESTGVPVFGSRAPSVRYGLQKWRGVALVEEFMGPPVGGTIYTIGEWQAVRDAAYDNGLVIYYRDSTGRMMTCALDAKHQLTHDPAIYTARREMTWTLNEVPNQVPPHSTQGFVRGLLKLIHGSVPALDTSEEAS